MNIHDLDTPALVVDLDIMERNLTRMADYAAAHKLRLRPHTKTHKIPALGARQIALGAAGLTVAKSTEAEIMVKSGTPDLLIAYPVLGARKLERIRAVSKETDITISVDSVEVAQQLSDAGLQVGVLAETDVGMGRVGVEPGAPLVDLAKAISRMPGIMFRGIAYYPGHIKSTDAAGMEAIAKLGALLASIRADFSVAGIDAPIFSGGSTPTMWHSHEVPVQNEIRPGTYIFNDRNSVFSGCCTVEDCAASILCTVVSTSVKDQFVIDGGSKTFSSDMAVQAGHGWVVEHPDALFAKMNEEHGRVTLADAKSKVKIGERVRVIPNHICVAVNLHEKIYGVRGGEVEEVWVVEGRGKLQ